MFRELFRWLSTSFSRLPEAPLAKPKFSEVDALATARKLAQINELFWDEDTVKITLGTKEFSTLCWKIFTGIESFGPADEWANTGQIDSATYIFINADTGNFAGIGGLRSVTPAKNIPEKYFKIK